MTSMVDRHNNMEIMKRQANTFVTNCIISPPLAASISSLVSYVPQNELSCANTLLHGQTLVPIGGIHKPCGHDRGRRGLPNVHITT